MAHPTSHFDRATHRVLRCSCILIALLSPLFASAAPEAATPATDAAILARIGDTEVKTEEIRAALEKLTPREQTALAQDPSLLSQAVRTLLVRKLVYKEALTKHWEREPGVAEQLEQARQNALIESYLESVSKPPAGYPSEAEIKTAYEAGKTALLVPKQFQLAQIFIATPKADDKASTEKAQNKLEAVRKKLKQRDADFAAIARADSDEPNSASRGGEIGWLGENRIQPEIRPSVVALAKNAISEPVRLADGWHILKLLDAKDACTPALDDVREQLVNEMRVERMRATSKAYLAKLLQENPVAVNELALSKVLK